jgi:hypothetical protein
MAVEIRLSGDRRVLLIFGMAFAFELKLFLCVANKLLIRNTRHSEKLSSAAMRCSGEFEPVMTIGFRHRVSQSVGR